MNLADPFYNRLIDSLIQSGQIDRSPQGMVTNLTLDETFTELLSDNLASHTLAQKAAEVLGYDFMDVATVSADDEALSLIPIKICRQYAVLPLSLKNNTLHVATANYFDSHLSEKLANISGHNIQISFGDYNAIKHYLYDEIGTSIAIQGLAQNDEEANRNDGKFYLLEENVSENFINIVNTILIDAINKAASDIHIERHESMVIIKYRLDGVLVNSRAHIGLSDYNGVISRIKVMSDLDISETRIPQDGRFSVKYQSRVIDIRTSILPSIFGEDIVLRILDKTGLVANSQQLSLDVLGLDDELEHSLRKMIHEPYGMVLVTGPTGSGKTTTLYAALNDYDLTDNKIITIEDPVEYQLNQVVQIQVDPNKGLTFANGLRSILRHDPDKILVGEIRDQETAEIAVQSAMTGHLVLSSVHANNAFDVINRFEHMGIDRYSFVSALNGIVAQRLVRKLCPSCKQLGILSAEEVHENGLQDKDIGREVYKAQACEQCNHTGYLGRSVVMELVRLTPELQDLIINKASYKELLQQASREGMVSLRESALNQFRNGITSLAEINRVTFSE